MVAALPPHEAEREDRSAEFRELVNECKASGRRDREGWKDRIRSIRCDGRNMGQCEAAVAEAKEHFGRVDILLCCTSEGACFFFSFSFLSPSLSLSTPFMPCRVLHSVLFFLCAR